MHTLAQARRERGCMACGKPVADGGLQCTECRTAPREFKPPTGPDVLVQVSPLAARVTLGEPQERRSEFDTKTEERYFRDFIRPLLDSGEVVAAMVNRLRFRLADRTWYKPDVVVVLPCGGLWVHEAKGAHVWDDARVKFKAAAEAYPWFRWTMVQRKDGEWRTLHDIAPAAPAEGD